MLLENPDTTFTSNFALEQSILKLDGLSYRFKTQKLKKRISGPAKQDIIM
jgi:hypothetical protein